MRKIVTASPTLVPCSSGLDSEDRVALITGSDSGIGHATAGQFAKEGADVAVNYLHDEEGANRTKGEVKAQGQRAIVVQADHGYEDQVEKLFGAAFDAFGKLDILMNNASADAQASMWQTSRSTRTNGRCVAT